MNNLNLILTLSLYGLCNILMSIFNLYIGIKEGRILSIIVGVFAGCGFFAILIMGIKYMLEERKEDEEWSKIWTAQK